MDFSDFKKELYKEEIEIIFQAEKIACERCVAEDIVKLSMLIHRYLEKNENFPVIVSKKQQQETDN